MEFTEEDEISGKNCPILTDDESSYEEFESDDSENDPSFDLENEVQSSLTRLSLTRKSKSRISKETKEDSDEALDVVDVDVPELGKEDQKFFETVQKKIEVGELEKLKVDQCKVYLRKYGLRLAGNKETLMQRIKEHLDVVNGGGETKYPVSSFVLNCKGDACTGDVVMFEQNVYEMFSIVSRSANGPPCGTRTIAGRIVKESYGAAKQQHTFTIEVLWSKGVKPLPPLHPLLIKGRNLYRLKTMRQKWENEAERQKVISEKHNRGIVARSTREERIQEKEKTKMLRANRASKMEKLKKKEGEKINTFHSQPMPSSSLGPQAFNQLQRQHSTTLGPHHAFSLGPHAFNQLQRQHSSMPTSSHTFQNQIPIHSQYQFQKPSTITHSHLFQQRGYHVENRNSFLERSQVCRYYAQGRCYYADRCKYLHVNRENQ